MVPIFGTKMVPIFGTKMVPRSPECERARTDAHLGTILVGTILVPKISIMLVP